MKKIKTMLIILLASFMVLSVNPARAQADEITLIPSGDKETFVNAIPLDGVNMYIDMDKINGENAVWTSTIDGLIEHNNAEGKNPSVYYPKNDMQVGDTIALDGVLEIVYPDAAVIKTDGSRADVKVTLSDILIEKYNSEKNTNNEAYISLYKLDGWLTESAVNEDFVGISYDKGTGNFRLHRQENIQIQIIKNGELVEGKYLYGMNDIDLPDKIQNADEPKKEYDDWDSLYSESIEPLSGFGDFYVTNDTVLVDDNGRVHGTMKDEETWDSGFMSVVDSDLSFIWRAGGSTVNTDLFTSIPIYVVKDSVIGGGEIKYVKDGQETDESVIFAKEGGEVDIITRPLEGHKIKKITVDGEDVTPTDKLSDFTYKFEDINADHEIIAEYEPFSYIIKYDANGGEGIMEPSKFVFTDETFMSKENAFTKAGEKFIGFKLEDREELITSPEDFKSLLVEMGDGAEITLVAQWTTEPTTQFVDIDTGETLSPEEVGKVEPKDISGYVYIETEVDAEDNQIHKYKAVKTNYVDEDGKELLEPKPGKHDPEDISGYKLVRTENDPKGDTTHVYHKVTTSWVDETGKILHPTEDGTLDPKVFPNYKLVKSEVKENGDTVHTYHHIQTSWVDEKSEKIVQSKPGEHPKEDFPSYEFIRTETKTNGDVVHHYHKLVNLKFVVEGKTVKEDKIRRGADGVAPEVLPKNGYKFVGWDKEFKNIQVDTVVTAKLEPIKYPITYVLDGGKNDDANPSSYTIEDAVTLKNPIKLGAKFLGWKEGNAIAKGSTGAKTFTAQWEIVTPPVNTGYNPALIEFATIISSSLAGLYVAMKKKAKK